jgi:hypothetical protein
MNDRLGQTYGGKLSYYNISIYQGRDLGHQAHSYTSNHNRNTKQNMQLLTQVERTKIE